MRTRRIGSHLVLAVVLSLGVGCATPSADVSSAVSPTANFKTYHTVALENASEAQGPEFAAIEKTIAEVLAEKGYRVGDKTSDLTLLYRLTRDRGEKLKKEIIPTAQGTLVRRNMEAVNEAKFWSTSLIPAVATWPGKASTVRDLTRQKLDVPGRNQAALTEFSPACRLISNQWDGGGHRDHVIAGVRVFWGWLCPALSCWRDVPQWWIRGVNQKLNLFTTFKSETICPGLQRLQVVSATVQ